jgi:hypothetical protein
LKKGGRGGFPLFEKGAGWGGFWRAENGQK